MEEDLEQLIESASDYYAWISKNDIPDPLPILGTFYDNYFDEETGLNDKRLEQIEKGAQPTEEEQRILLDAWIFKAFEGPLHQVKQMAFVSMKSEKESWLIVSTVGTSFEGTYSEIYGKFPTKESAIKNLTEEGYLE